MGSLRQSRVSDNHREPRLYGAIHQDGDVARIIVAADGPEKDHLSVVSCREGTRSDLPRLVEEAAEFAATRRNSSALDLATCLTGDDVLHDVRHVPAQVRSFDENVRLDAVLAGSRWGNVAAVTASGYTVGHAFRGDQCLLAVTRTETLLDVAPLAGVEAVVSTDAFGLLALVDRVRPDLLEPSAGATLAMMCHATSVAVCAISDGCVRVLHQASLLDRMRTVRPATVSTAAGARVAEEMEFEFAGSYSIPSGMSNVQPLAEIRAAEIESSVYQSALLHLVDEVLALASESQPFSPDYLLVTGEAVHRHAVAAYLRNCFGSSVITDELDAALALRIDEPALAREVAAEQAQYAGAIGALAAATARVPLIFPRAAANAGIDSLAGPSRSGAAVRVSPALLVFLALLLLTGGGMGATRWMLVSRRHSAIATQLESETQRRRELSAIAEEWKVAESRLAHTRALLETIKGHRLRQLNPPRLLAAVRSLLPADARLSEISFSGGVIKLSGYCEYRDVGPTIALAMEQNRESFTEVTPQTNTATMKLPNPDTGEEADTSVHTFTIAARYVGGEAR